MGEGGEEVLGAIGLVCPMACKISALLAGGIITYSGATRNKTQELVHQKKGKKQGKKRTSPY